MGVYLWGVVQVAARRIADANRGNYSSSACYHSAVISVLID